MEVTGSTSTASRTDLVAEGTYDPYAELGFEEFMDLLIAELTNQDPMEPTSNADLMNQLGQIREIASTDQLTNTLDAVMLSQSFATAGNAVDKVVDGLSDEGDRVCGTVISVAIEEGAATLKVEDEDGKVHSIALNNIANLYPGGTSLPTPGFAEFHAQGTLDKVIDGLSEEGERICGTVVGVTIDEGEAILKVEDEDGEVHSVAMSNIDTLYPKGTPLPTPGYADYVAQGRKAGNKTEGDAGAPQGETADEVDEPGTEGDGSTPPATEGDGSTPPATEGDGSTPPATETENDSTGDGAASSGENSQAAA